MSERFYFEPDDENTLSGRVMIIDAEARHVSQVMRKKPGEEIVVFDGRSGLDHLCAIETIGKNKVELRIIESRAGIPEPEIELSIAVSLPKGDRQKWLIEKLTELGVARVIPLQCERSVAKADDSVVQRLKRGVIEASKQCGRSRLMEIENGTTADELSRSETPIPKFLAHPYTESGSGEIFENGKTIPRKVIIAIGPEGGFSPEETEFFEKNTWKPITFGPRILRIETAAIAFAGFLLLART